MKKQDIVEPNRPYLKKNNKYYYQSMQPCIQNPYGFNLS